MLRHRSTNSNSDEDDVAFAIIVEQMVDVVLLPIALVDDPMHTALLPVHTTHHLRQPDTARQLIVVPCR